MAIQHKATEAVQVYGSFLIHGHYSDPFPVACEMVDFNYVEDNRILNGEPVSLLYRYLTLQKPSVSLIQGAIVERDKKDSLVRYYLFKLHEPTDMQYALLGYAPKRSVPKGVVILVSDVEMLIMEGAKDMPILSLNDAHTRLQKKC